MILALSCIASWLHAAETACLQEIVRKYLFGDDHEGPRTKYAHLSIIVAEDRYPSALAVTMKLQHAACGSMLLSTTACYQNALDEAHSGSSCCKIQTELLAVMHACMTTPAGSCCPVLGMLHVWTHSSLKLCCRHHLPLIYLGFGHCSRNELHYHCLLLRCSGMLSGKSYQSVMVPLLLESSGDWASFQRPWLTTSAS